METTGGCIVSQHGGKHHVTMLVTAAYWHAASRFLSSKAPVQLRVLVCVCVCVYHTHNDSGSLELWLGKTRPFSHHTHGSERKKLLYPAPVARYQLPHTQGLGHYRLLLSPSWRPRVSVRGAETPLEREPSFPAHLNQVVCQTPSSASR